MARLSTLPTGMLVARDQNRLSSRVMAPKRGDGILLVAHGTVDDLNDLPEFLAEIRRGIPAPASLVQELKHRYTAIGGSPLLDLTRAQASSLEAELDCPVLVAMRLWRPRVEDVLAEPQARGLARLCVLPLAPYSVHVYNAAAARAFDATRAKLGNGPEPVFVEQWGLCPELIAAHVALIREALAGVEAGAGVLLTAHSLPRAVIEAGDPYADLLGRAAAEIGCELDHPVTLGFQSQGADGGEWLGPDLPQAFQALRAQGVSTVVLAPFGFLADHVETLYDVDIEARGQAEALGLNFVRVPVLNTHPALIHAMAQVVRRALS